MCWLVQLQPGAISAPRHAMLAVRAQASEVKYVRTLRLVHNVFIEPLKAGAAISTPELHLIFRTWHGVRDIHTEMQGAFTAASGEDSVNSAVSMVAGEIVRCVAAAGADGMARRHAASTRTPRRPHPQHVPSDGGRLPRVLQGA